MNTPVPPPESPASPAAADNDAPPASDLDPEEDVAPNLGGEDQMQDA